MSNTHLLYEKISHGTHLTDKEILEGMEKFRAADQALVGLGLAFQVTRKECSMMFDKLRGMAAARGLLA